MSCYLIIRYQDISGIEVIDVTGFSLIRLHLSSSSLMPHKGQLILKKLCLSYL
jgi:hypothetical protein